MYVPVYAWCCRLTKTTCVAINQTIYTIPYSGSVGDDCCGADGRQGCTCQPRRRPLSGCEPNSSHRVCTTDSHRSTLVCVPSRPWYLVMPILSRSGSSLACSHPMPSPRWTRPPSPAPAGPPASARSRKKLSQRPPPSAGRNV